MARAVIEGFDTYRSFTPPHWTPPAFSTELYLLGPLLADEQAWSLLAESDGRLVGQVTFLPATLHARPVADPALAHLRNLFVHRDFWGTGLANDLHAAAIEAARDRGFAQMRLFTPADHGRARRFYEREGWTQSGEPAHDDALGMAIVEYRYALS